MNAQALKLPDPLLVRYYREGRIDQVAQVTEKKRTRDVVVTMTDGKEERWQFLRDVGWIPAGN